MIDNGAQKVSQKLSKALGKAVSAKVDEYGVMVLGIDYEQGDALVALVQDGQRFRDGDIESRRAHEINESTIMLAAAQIAAAMVNRIEDDAKLSALAVRCARAMAAEVKRTAGERS